MKREKEFKEYLKNKRIDLTSCIKTYEDYNIRITEVLNVLDEELGMSYQAASNVIDGNIVTLIIQIMDWEDKLETIDYDTFTKKYQEYDKEYDKEYEPKHYKGRERQYDTCRTGMCQCRKGYCDNMERYGDRKDIQDNGIITH